MKKLLIGMLTSSLLLGSSQVQANTIFTDISGNHWASASIQSGVKNGYVNGFQDGTFRPNEPVTRAQFIKMLVQAFHLPVQTSNKGEAWYKPFLNQAVYSGFLKWSDFDKGDWNTGIQRDEMARIAVRAVDQSIRESKEDVTLNRYLYEAISKGLLSGDKSGINPDGVMTRAQAVVIMERILTLRSGGKLPVDQKTVLAAEKVALGHNFSAFGLDMKVDLPVTLEVDGFKYTLHEIYIYTMDSKTAKDLDKKYKFVIPTFNKPKYLIWTNLTVKNGTKDTYRVDGRDLYEKWRIGITENESSDPLLSDTLRKYNNEEYLSSWILKPGESIISNQAYAVTNDVIDNMKLILVTKKGFKESILVDEGIE